MSTNCGGQQFFSVFHGPSTLKLFLPALHHDMILSYTKLFNKKMHEKRGKTEKTCEEIFSSFNRWYENRKTQKRKYSNIYTTDQKACNSVKKRLQHKCFSVKFPKFLKTLFLIQHLQWLLLTYAKSFLVLFIIRFV